MISPVKANIANCNGSPAIFVNGSPIPQMTATIMPKDSDSGWLKEYYRKLGEAGIRVFFVIASTDWLVPGGDGRKSGSEKTIEDIRFILDVVPDAYIMLRLYVSPPRDWVNSHPEEQVVFNDGSRQPVICTSISMEPLDAMHSMCSELWRSDGDKAISEYFEKISAYPEFDRIIGTFICAGGTSEWYYPQGIQNLEKGIYADFSEPFRREFEKYIREKYKTVEELRRVWKMPEATFEHPVIPSIKEREFAEQSDEKILNGLRRWEEISRTIGAKIDIDAKEKANEGVFLNANGFAHVADFYSAWHRATAHTIVHFAKTLKRIQPGLLTGAFYGSFACQSFFDGGTASGTLEILDSGYLDFLAAPGVYNNREPGGVVAQREMQDSFRLRNLIYICEDDSRTHLCKPWMQRDAMALYSVRDSIVTLKRDFARDLCEDVQGWWFDMGPGWYDDPVLLDLIKRQQEIAADSYTRDRTKKNEIALIFDVESVHHVSQCTSSLVLDFWRTSDIHRIGAPVDWYFHNDVARPEMADYKFYIMVNCYYLTDEEREAIYAKAAKNGAVILWLYAPGFINPGAEEVLSAENISKTARMKAVMHRETRFPHFRVNPASHPAVALASATRRYGIIDRDIHSNIWLGNAVNPPYANPWFSIDDADALVLGSYCHDGSAAMALKETGGVTSIYCAAPVVRSDLLASIAKWAGCHLFEEGCEDVIYANEHYVAVHAASDGKRTIRFKRKCSPFEVYEKRYYGRDTDSIEVEMKLGDTLMWQI